MVPETTRKDKSMKHTKLIAIATIMVAMVAVTAGAADFVVSVKATCTRTDFDDNKGTEKLVREPMLREQFLQMCLDSDGQGLTLNDVELTYDADFEILHVVRTCDGVEVCELGSAFCVYADNFSSSGDKDKTSSNRACVLEIFFFSIPAEIYGTALGKEKFSLEETQAVETKSSFKASYTGQYELFTLDDEYVCTIKFKAGSRFQPTGLPCPP
jgi:hypothetical protein